jgi:hypothetical protein
MTQTQICLGVKTAVVNDNSGLTVIYRGTRDVSRESAPFPGTLVLLCVLIAMVTQVIGDNVALAFSLVGALSVVRFRTAVRDTKDTAFVIFAVAVGMAIGAGQLVHVALGLGEEVGELLEALEAPDGKNTVDAIADINIYGFNRIYVKVC